MNHAKNKGRVHPGQVDKEGLVNGGFEMDSVNEEKSTTNKVVEKMRLAGGLTDKKNPLIMIPNLKAGAARWREYINSRRTLSVPGSEGEVDRRKTGGDGLTTDMGKVTAANDDKFEGLMNSTQLQLMKDNNKRLIEYFAQLGESGDEDECINLEYVDYLLKNGANINCTDKYGQTVLHEAARVWHVDVAKFLIEHKADINQADNYGRTALHIAAAVDYAEMVTFLMDSGADKEAKTKGENQTSVHFAARNDACQSLKALIKAGCKYKDERDYKGRTPLHLAAELDRSETARLLMELPDPAPAGVEDNSGQSAVVWMITKMPPVAKLALDQFHTTDRANRKQYFHLHRLEPRKPGEECKGCPQTALRQMVTFRRFDLIIHPVMTRLIRLKWHKFGRKGAILNTFWNLCFILLWTAQGILVEFDKRYKYILPEHWWRIVLFLFAVALTIWQVVSEIREYTTSKKRHTTWKEWRMGEINRDLKYSHPRWPEEEQYLRQEMAELDKIQPNYFSDFWNIFDWMVYMLLVACVITHIVDVVNHTDFSARLHIRIMAITVILIWLRLMKNARAFSALGPFIVMVSHMIGDVLIFALLYLEFYIPYACAFWMMFGGDRIPEDDEDKPDPQNYTMTVSGMQNPNALLFTMFRLTLVDDYDYDGMKQVDSIMADILVGTWLALSAILMLNIFIALLSDTFQRVYDNARANAVMQKAITILSHEENLSYKKREKFRRHVHEVCGPEQDFYDDDNTSAGGEDLQKVTIQIKEDLAELREVLDQKLLNKKPVKSAHVPRSAMGSKASLREDLGEMSLFLKEKLNTPKQHRDADTDEFPPHLDDSRCVSVDKFELEIDRLREDIQLLAHNQRSMMDRVKRDVNSLKSILQQIAVHTVSDLEGARPMLQSSQELAEVPVRHRTVEEMFSEMPPRSQSRSGSRNSGQRHIAADDFNLPRDGGTFKRSSSRRSGRRSADDEWDRMDKKRKRELKKLREQLAQQQQLQANQNLHQTSTREVQSDDEVLLNNGQPLVELSQQEGEENVFRLTDSPSVKVTSRRRHVSDGTTSEA